VLTNVSDDIAALLAAAAGILRAQGATRREAGSGIVGADLHHNLAANAVRFDYAPD
jgi:hypothetical protein